MIAATDIATFHSAAERSRGNTMPNAESQLALPWVSSIVRCFLNT